LTGNTDLYSITFMLGITTVTQKGQITIPKRIRETLSINKYDKVYVEAMNSYIKVTPAKSILDIAPLAKAPKGKDALKAREAMEKTYSRV